MTKRKKQLKTEQPLSEQQLSEQDTNILQEALSWIKVLSFALVVGLGLTMFFKPTLVSGLSMFPTLNDHDYLIMNRVAYQMGEPHYKDIVVFNSDVEGGKVLIKRVIGVEGDRVRVHEGHVWVNGKELKEPYINGDTTIGEVDTTVPKDSLFVMGDNRGNSLDSRFPQVGFAKEDSVIGKVLFRLFPMKSIKD